jgi:uncharacterized membrane protein YhaH (DUF805 family)
MNWYIEVLKKYAVFSGRARRKEYWMFVLISTIISIVLSALDAALGLTRMGGVGPLDGIYSLAVLIPSIAVSIRRLHDTNRSGWWLLINMIPVIGWIIYFVFLVSDSDPGTNEYGPNPKAYAAY